MSDFQELATLLCTLRFSLERVRAFDELEQAIEFLKGEEVVADATRLLELVARVDGAHDCKPRTLLSALLFHVFPRQAEGINPHAGPAMQTGAAVVARFELMREVAAADGQLQLVTPGFAECLLHYRECLRTWRDFEAVRLHATIALLTGHILN
jgi:hypothetical protein